MKHKNLQKDNVICGWMSFEWMEIMKHTYIKTYNHRNIRPLELLETNNRPWNEQNTLTWNIPLKWNMPMTWNMALTHKHMLCTWTWQKYQLETCIILIYYKHERSHKPHWNLEIQRVALCFGPKSRTMWKYNTLSKKIWDICENMLVESFGFTSLPWHCSLLPRLSKY
jgi:hypothetical protein